ncbi:MAG: hypothetical protein JEZ09_06360 [Salinivirgaceae bacterium]|nr:hypothetical protein [Salinivirgaceae bacterium]
MNSNQIIKNIHSKTNERGYSVPQDYFVGITSNPEERIFNEHNINREESFYTFFEASTELDAKKAFEKLLKYNMHGFPSLGNIPGKFVYCYYIEGTSKECYTSFE